MKFAASLVAATMFAMASAKVAFTSTDFKVTEGKPFTLQWAGNTGPVDIVLISGPDELHLVPVKTIQSGVSGSTLTFTPSGIPSGTYAFRITDQADTSNPNFSVPFQYSGTGSLTSGTASGSIRPTSTSATTGATTSTSGSTTTSSSGTSSTSSTTRTSSTSTSSSPTSRPTNNTNTNDSPKYKSPLALVLVTVATLVYFS